MHGPRYSKPFDERDFIKRQVFEIEAMLMRVELASYEGTFLTIIPARAERPVEIDEESQRRVVS